MNNELLKRIVSAMLEQNIAVNKIILLEATIRNFNETRDYIAEIIFKNTDEKIIQCLGKKVWNDMLPIPENGETILAVELLALGGWLVEITCYLPNAKRWILFRDGKVIGWLREKQTRYYYGHTLEEALCRALIWTARERRRIFKDAWERQNNGKDNCNC